MDGTAGLVVRPRNADEVGAVLAAAYAMRIPVVPSGGRTGLAGGATAPNGELVLSLERMRHIDPVDRIGATVRAEAGATNAALQEACAPFGMHWPVDLGSRGTATVGGNLSTNAGGLRVIRYGMTRRWVLGVEAFLIDGTRIARKGALEKRNCGYDWSQLLIGSEGTLAVITAATLKLAPLPGDTLTVFFGLEGTAALPLLLDAARKLERPGLELNGFEFFTRRCLDAVMNQLGYAEPFSSQVPVYALVEFAVPKHAKGVAEELHELAAVPGIRDAVVAASTADREKFWRYREGITEALQHSGRVRKYDCSVPVARGAAFLSEAETVFRNAALPLEVYLFGHFGDGSPHVNLLQPPGIDTSTFASACAQAETILYDLLARYDGTPSAEHGIGRGKLGWMARQAPEELAMLRAIKKTFDPENLLNPGKILP